MAGPRKGPEKVSAERLAQLFNVTTRRVQQLASDGVIPRPAKRGEYNLDDAVRGYVQWLQDRVQNREGGSLSADLRKEQLRRIRMENDTVARELVSRDEIREGAAQIGGLVVRLCESLRGRLTPLIAPYLREDVDPSFLPGIIDDEQRRIRREIIDSARRQFSIEPVSTNADAAEGENVGPVGRQRKTFG